MAAWGAAPDPGFCPPIEPTSRPTSPKGYAGPESAAHQVQGQTVEDLEGPDGTIALQRAAQIAGLTLHSIGDLARAGRLAAIRPGHDRLITCRDLHRYLSGR